MTRNRIALVVVAAVLLLLTAGCSEWDSITGSDDGGVPLPDLREANTIVRTYYRDVDGVKLGAPSQIVEIVTEAQIPEAVTTNAEGFTPERLLTYQDDFYNSDSPGYLRTTIETHSPPNCGVGGQQRLCFLPFVDGVKLSAQKNQGTERWVLYAEIELVRVVQ